MKRKWVIRAILATTLLAGPVASLAENVASSQARWPWLLDYIRKHPWIAIGVSIAILSLAYYAESRSVDVPQPKKAEPQESLPSVTLNHSTINAPTTVQVVQGQALENVSLTANEDRDRDPIELQPTQKPVVLYSVLPFVDSGRWEEKIHVASEAGTRKALCFQFGSVSLPPELVVAVVVVFLCAQYPLITRRITARLRKVKNEFPSARLILAAVDRSDPMVEDEDGRRLLRATDYDIDQNKFIISITVDNFSESVSLHIENALREYYNRLALPSSSSESYEVQE
ncbi:hypothetical protein OG417_05005 [Actinoallomurus sp. NBC_01490]|uniref:hypothetical protein n=1 Tax=Actinoallomurus sp. NBC_01490 TaxID=2903557 RepID=UPI002E32C8A6|nr:hypothetical protein [Actinoallomurus sp. NBC_01490]